MFAQFLALSRAVPDAPAVIDAASGEVTTREQLTARAAETARRLAAGGAEAGDLLAVQLRNSVGFIATLLAAMELRLIFVPIDRDAPAAEVTAILDHFAVRVFIDGQGTMSFRPVPSPRALPPAARLLKLTSGSTGLPKGIVCSEASLLADATNICSTMGIAPDDVNLGAIPFSHSYGLGNLVLPLLMQGTAVVASNDYLPLSLAEVSERHRCTIAPLIPMVFEHLASSPQEAGRFSTVRTFLSAGAPLPPIVSARFRERFGRSIHSFYGCSEAGGITYDREGAAAERGTVGSPMANVTITLDPQTRRLTVRGAAVSLGVLLDAGRFEPFDGSFVTDDLAEIDSRGEIVLTGRAGELINTAGKKVNPREVEQIVLQLEGVREAKVWGEPAGARGEVVAVAVVADAHVTREQVRAFCRARLAPHKVPRIVKLIERLPLDERGKVKRAALARL
jgi:acyl-CoA synthetase (AMP-forming)/AMP-acid ligase II